MGELDELRSLISIVSQATTKLVGDLNNYQDSAVDPDDVQILYGRFKLQRGVIEQALSEIATKLRYKASQAKKAGTRE